MTFHLVATGPRNGNPPSLLNRTTFDAAYSPARRRIILPPDHALLLVDCVISLWAVHYAVHRVLFRESIFSVYAIDIPVRLLFATSSLVSPTTGIHPDTVFGTALRRACGASCIRLHDCTLKPWASFFSFTVAMRWVWSMCVQIPTISIFFALYTSLDFFRMKASKSSHFSVASLWHQKVFFGT